MKHICNKCIKNKVLIDYLLKNSIVNTCSYCGTEFTQVIPSQDLITFAGDRLIDSLYSIEEASPYEAGMFWEGSDVLNFQEVAYIIQNIEVGHEDFEDELAEYIDTNTSSEDKLFIIDDGFHDNNSYQFKWDNFTKSTAHKHRFFNKDAKVFLDSLFELIVENDEIRDNVITVIDSSTQLYRARIANEETIRKQIIADPVSHLGPVPKRLAGEQRMTPTGISALYCSLDRDTCFSEIRAITGDILISGAFKPVKDLPLLDLTKLHILSQLTLDPFDEGFSDFSHKSAFIKDLLFLMSKPASKNNSSSYLSTQIIFEYLAVKFGNKLSGIMFKSVQTGGNGTNVVLFPDYSTITPSEMKAEDIKNISEYRGDSYDHDYYYYSIHKIDNPIANIIRANENLEFVENSLLASKVDAVITKTTAIEISISVK